jgi:hypothetical protein
MIYETAPAADAITFGRKTRGDRAPQKTAPRRNTCWLATQW